ncbi:MAG: pyruvate kinase [Holosporaceae bacterium]|jgi:pyruvate kinase|nr:pyruvate kinase [Holosporaceae bacterium]
MKRNRNSKIMATIGPATSSSESLEKLCLYGVDIFRLNFSHGFHEDHAKVYEAIRTIGRKHSIFPTILADLQGPKLRIGTFEDGKSILKEGEIFRLDLDAENGNSKRVYLPHPEILKALQPGTLLLLDDGKLKLEVLATEKNYADAKVLVGGQLSDKKGINIPNLMLPIPSLTKKDLKDLDFALGLGVDWVALSFVQNIEDIEKAREIIKNRAGVVSKLEKPLAIDALEPIIDASDAVMIARGDLGVEMNQEDLPVIQRNALRVCHRMGRPVIVATQMMESMITSPVPTRAEVSDVANAIYQGADVVMLSAESAMGKYPFETVKIMNKIIEKTEADPLKIIDNEDLLPNKTVLDAICVAAKDAAVYSCASTIVLFTDSFETVRRCSRIRPDIPIILITASSLLASKAGICHGIQAIVAKKEFDGGQVETAKFIATERKFAIKGDYIAVVNDISSNSITICRI